MEKGTVFWITGLSGAGKTTIGKELYNILRKHKSNIVFLDGDELRSVFGNDLGYSTEDRLICAKRYSNICELLSKQGIDVICCTISMFDEIRVWNRGNIENYKEIYIEVPMDVLKKRNQKGLYSGVEDKEVKSVVGMDIEVQLPKNPDVIIKNTGSETPNSLAIRIKEELNIGNTEEIR